MKKTHFFSMLIALLCSLCSLSANCQLTQYAIGSAGNEIAVKVRYDSAEQSTIIAGYTYDYTGGVVSNCQAVVMKIFHGGAIAWQKTFGVAAHNNIIKDMILTEDGNIVVVGTVGGTGAVYSNNTAAILKFNATTGALMWQTCLKDAATTTGGEIFYGVTELHDGTHRLVAVGIHDLTPSGAGGMICVFQPTGSLIYNQLLDIGNGDDFYSVATSAAGNSVYMCGVYVGNYKDGRLLSYTPGATTGTVNWSKYFDFTLDGTFSCNYFTSVYQSGSKLIVSGSCIAGYSTSSGIGHFVMTVNAADGSGAQIKSIKNSGTVFSNTPCIAVQDSNHIYAIQSPSAAYYDPVTWITGVSSNTVVNNITSFSAGTSAAPVKFVSVIPGTNSFMDVDYYSGFLHLAGATNMSSGFGNNDIYYVETGTGLASVNHDCDTSHETISMVTTPFTNPSTSFTSSSFTPVYSTVDTATTTLDIRRLCGDLDMPTSIPGNTELATGIFPNPTTGILNIRNADRISSLKITDITGRIVYQHSFNAATATVDMGNMPRGMYFVQINNGKVEKVIKN